MDKISKAKVVLRENVEYVLRDKDGNVKKLFQPNKIGAWLLKHGIVSPTLKLSVLLGNYADQMVVSNLVMNVGMAGVASRINGAGAEVAFTYIAIGIGTTAVAAGDTQLDSEITTGGGARAVATASRVTTDVTNDTAQLVLTYNFTDTFAVTESGVLNAASAGTLLARQVFSAVNVVNGDSLQITWKLDVD